MAPHQPSQAGASANANEKPPLPQEALRASKSAHSWRTPPPPPTRICIQMDTNRRMEESSGRRTEERGCVRSVGRPRVEFYVSTACARRTSATGAPHLHLVSQTITRVGIDRCRRPPTETTDRYPVSIRSIHHSRQSSIPKEKIKRQIFHSTPPPLASNNQSSAYNPPIFFRTPQNNANTTFLRSLFVKNTNPDSLHH